MKESVRSAQLSKYAGQEIQFVISEYNPKRRRYIGDRKQLIVAEKAELQKKLFESIQEGDVPWKSGIREAMHPRPVQVR